MAVSGAQAGAGIARAALAALLVLVSVSVSARPPLEPSYTGDGVEACTRCHMGGNMLLMAATVHGDPQRPYTPYAEQGCESCHGPGSLHVSRARGGHGHPPLLTFGPGNPAPPQNAACLSCHGAGREDLESVGWTGTLHDAGMSCSTCHELHVAEDPMSVQATQQARCATCHTRQLEAHPPFGNFKCSQCHNAHTLTRAD